MTSSSSGENSSDSETFVTWLSRWESSIEIRCDVVCSAMSTCCGNAVSSSRFAASISCRKWVCASRIWRLLSCSTSTRVRCTSPRSFSCQPRVDVRRSACSWSRRSRSCSASASPADSARLSACSFALSTASALDNARSVLASPSIAERPTSSSCNAVWTLAMPDFSRSIAAICSLGAFAAVSNIRGDTAWNTASAKRGACSASSCRSAASTSRQPRNMSTLVSANTTVSTRSPTSRRNCSSVEVNGADASTTNSSAVAPAAASLASSPCIESSPPTPGVSTSESRSSSGTGPVTST